MPDYSAKMTIGDLTKLTGIFLSAVGQHMGCSGSGPDIRNSLTAAQKGQIMELMEECADINDRICQVVESGEQNYFQLDSLNGRINASMARVHDILIEGASSVIDRSILAGMAPVGLRTHEARELMELNGMKSICGLLKNTLH